MILKQPDTEQGLGAAGVIEAFKKAHIVMDECMLLAVNDGTNQVLIKDEGNCSINVVELELELRPVNRLNNPNGSAPFVTGHKVLRTYSLKYLQAENEAEFPPPRATLENLVYLDCISHLLMMTYPDQDWTGCIEGVDATNKKILVQDPSIGRYLEVSFMVHDGDVFVHGLPQVYWDVEAPKAF